MEKLEHKIKRIWMAKLGLIGFLLGLILAIPVYGLTERLSLALIPFMFLPVIGAWYAVLRYFNWGFELREDHVYIQRGVLVKVVSMVPHVRIQHIDTHRTPLERVFGLTSLKIFTAGSRGTDVRIPGLDKTRAKEIQEHLRDVAIESEKGFDGV